MIEANWKVSTQRGDDARRAVSDVVKFIKDMDSWDETVGISTEKQPTADQHLETVLRPAMNAAIASFNEALDATKEIVEEEG